MVQKCSIGRVSKTLRSQHPMNSVQTSNLTPSPPNSSKSSGRIQFVDIVQLFWILKGISLLTCWSDMTWSDLWGPVLCDLSNSYCLGRLWQRRELENSDSDRSHLKVALTTFPSAIKGISSLYYNSSLCMRLHLCQHPPWPYIVNACHILWQWAWEKEKWLTWQAQIE